MADEASPHTAGLPQTAECPFCGSHDSRPLATFGSLLMTAQYYCRSCRTTFERVRREEAAMRKRPDGVK